MPIISGSSPSLCIFVPLCGLKDFLITRSSLQELGVIFIQNPATNEETPSDKKQHLEPINERK
jgi:hypothetical protein